MTRLDTCTSGSKRRGAHALIKLIQNQDDNTVVLREDISTLCKHRARCNKKHLDVYWKETKLPVTKLVVQLTQSITGKCDDMIKQGLMEDLF